MLSIPRSTKLVQGVSCLMISFLIEKKLPASSRTCTSTHLMKLLTALSSYCYHRLTVTNEMTLSYSLYFFEVLGNRSIAIVCSPDCDVIYLEISLMFLNKPLLKMIKRLREKI